jgi:hypothetical protein
MNSDKNKNNKKGKNKKLSARFVTLILVFFVLMCYCCKKTDEHASKSEESTVEQYALDHSSHEAYMDSFLKALQAGKRDVYLSGFSVS